MKDRKGIALILSVGILALLAVIATSFALNMRLEYKATMNYYNGVKARYLAEAAIQEAIARLREHVKLSAFDDLSEEWVRGSAGEWDIVSDSTVTIGTNGEASVTIVDEQRKININTVNQDFLKHYATMRDIQQTAPDWFTDGICDFRDSNNLVYLHVSDIKRIPMTYWEGLGVPVPIDADTIEQAYNAIKDDLTANSYVDTKVYDRDGNLVSSGRAPININTANENIVRAILAGLDDSESGDEIPDTNMGIYTSNVKPFADAIVSRRSSAPFTSWAEFSAFLDSYTATLTDDQKALVMYNCNPNKTDKPSLQSTTEFCFNSGGVYEITGEGRVLSPDDPNSFIAEKEVTAIVKIYNIHNETIKDDFEKGNPIRVTWLDSCPVESDEIFGSFEQTLSSATQAPGSIKLGFWDDFDETTLNQEEPWVLEIDGRPVWTEANGTIYYDPGGNPNFDGDLDNDFELRTASGDHPKFFLDDDRWEWTDFNMRVYACDPDLNRPTDTIDPGWEYHGAAQMRHVGWILFQAQSSATDELSVPVFLFSPGGRLEWGWIWNWVIPETDPDTGEIRYTNSTRSRYDDLGTPILTSTRLWMSEDAAINYVVPITGGGTVSCPLLDSDNEPAQVKDRFTYGTGWRDYRYPYPIQVRMWPDQEGGHAQNATQYYAEWSGYYTESKIYNLLVKNSEAAGRVYNSNGDSLPDSSTPPVYPIRKALQTGYGGVPISGRIGLYGNATKPLWDDIRIISPDGNFTSQAIDPPDVDSVTWGTITGTILHPQSAVSLRGRINIQTSANGLSDNDPLDDPSFDRVNLNSASNLSMPLIDPSTGNSYESSSIRYKAFFEQHANDADMTETPILDDVTITYLPRVEILSWNVQ